MQEDLITRLRGDTQLAGLLGTEPRANRPMVDWVTRPDGSQLPAIVMYKVSPGVEYDQENPTALEGPRVQFSIIGESYGQAVLVFRRLRALLETGATVGSTIFDKAFLDAARDLNPKEVQGGEREYLLSADFIIWHRRAAS